MSTIIPARLLATEGLCPSAAFERPLVVIERALQEPQP